jgi:hypothetical protein
MGSVLRFAQLRLGFRSMPAKKTPVPKPKARLGPKSKAKREALIAEAVAAQIAPLDYMLMVLNEAAPKPAPREDPELYFARLNRYEDRRMDAAKAAAPYVHPRPQASIKLESVETVEDRPTNILELAKQVAFLFTLSQVRPEVDITPRQIN